MAATSPLEELINRDLLTIGSYELTVGRIVAAIAFPVLIIIASKVIRKLLKKALARHNEIDVGTSNAIVTTTYYLCLILGFTTFLWTLGINMTSLAVFSGAAGVGIGLGLQDFAKNFIGGIIILFTRPIKPGDRVELGPHIGEVKKITSYSTVIQLLNKSHMILPNASILNGEVINWHYEAPRRTFDISFVVPFDADTRWIEGLMAKVAEDHPDVLMEPAPSIRMVGFNESGVQYSLWVTVDKVTEWVRIKSEINNTILGQFREHNVHFGVPLRRVDGAKGAVAD
ncbi:mechanosensitive ion channel [Kamptonema cortianum]|nr:mechanosensitive ion channel [Geitlerinema splendidum]MDK3160348.1 mechanosensitive ion channel [Kamptonema cortianum]